LQEISHRPNAELDVEQKLCSCSPRDLLEASLVHDEAYLLIRGPEETDSRGICADAAVDVCGGRRCASAQSLRNPSEARINPGSRGDHALHNALTIRRLVCRNRAEIRACNRLLQAGVLT